MSMFPSPYKDDSEESMGLAFMRVYSKWHDEIQKRLRKTGVTHPQFVILAALGYLSQSHDEVTQTMIGHMAEIDVMSVSQILTLLEKRDCIERHAHSKDTRANSVVLTSVGRETMEAALLIVEEVDAMFFGSLGKREKSFKSCLDSLRRYEF